MATFNESNVNNELQANFIRRLPKKINEITNLSRKVFDNSACDSSIKELHIKAHNLAGASGTYGAIQIGAIAKKIDELLSQNLKDSDLSSVIKKINEPLDNYINQLLRALHDWKPSPVTFPPPKNVIESSQFNSFLYLVEDDELLIPGLVSALERFDYKVFHFINIRDFELACVKEMPSAIIMDMVFKEGQSAGADIIFKLKESLIDLPPVIFISVRNDFDIRLAAARAGAHRYFTKPLNMSKLIGTLNGLTQRVSIKPYRVLIVDDDRLSLELYKGILTDSGMHVCILSDPKETLSKLSEFNPDILLLDVYMPNCTGPELAQVIRQDDAYTMMPIMFLSAESDLNKQLSAMDLGGDDFLVKPVEPIHLISAVTVRAKRSRWSMRINKDLKNALRESEYQLATMNQHDIVSVTDIKGRITSVNDKFCQISGYSRKELIGQNHRILKSHYHNDTFYKKLWDTISNGSIWRGIICNCKKMVTNIGLNQP
ncbi:response regulator [Pseudoalteromonas denitrificans]|uniref:PAS domain S-box-containing protein n=1 Tax=Pseudoalteromonas denitrificans DSM 6059 TaxID=1123010 RepID=A0A1I1MQM8_9GAMM|nr:response regulator [Pseudoalteromonas denitrificans]SFC87485.1 PAS domain S-box-containing protein [Pseudoalteromonas denitrificans DSM 6059]